MGGSEVRVRVEPTKSVFALKEGGSEGVNHADMSVKIEGSWPCVSREGSIGLTHRTERREGLCNAQGFQAGSGLNWFGSPGLPLSRMATCG